MRRDILTVYRALAAARAQLAPVYRAQAVEAVARALAGGHDEAVTELRVLLDDADFGRAFALGVRLHKARDVATFDRVVQTCKAAIVSRSRRIAKFGSWIAPKRRPRRRNKWNRLYL